MKVGEIIENTYTTSQIAKIIGVHSNTVRMYEELGLISKPFRKANGYRIFNDVHIDQFRLARTAFQIKNAIVLTHVYIDIVDSEIANANEAAEITNTLLKKLP